MADTYYARNREKRLAYAAQYRKKNKALIAEKQRIERCNEEYRAVRRVKRTLQPSQQPEVRNAYRRARRSAGLPA